MGFLSTPFSKAFGGDKGRRSDYRKWSERAIVVGFNSSNGTYSIEITTAKLEGNNKRSLNRFIRQVKALMPPDTRQFAVGDAILIGYADEKREHPIILGDGDHIQQKPIKIRLGGQNEGATDPAPFLPAFDLLITCFTDSGDPNPDCEIDCGSSDQEIQFVATGGVGDFFTWETTVGSIITSGNKNQNAVLSAPVGATVSGVAYITPECVLSTQEFCFNEPKCHCNNLTRDYGCDDVFIELEECGTCRNLSFPCGVIQCDEFCTAFGKPACNVESLDVRTQPQKDAGCNPCGVSMVSAIVTVTDSGGNQISVTVTVINSDFLD